MNFRQMMAEFHPDLAKKFNSEQHKLSKKIIGKNYD